MVSATAYFWKRTPFIRLFPPFAAGIIFQWYCQWPLLFWWVALVIAAAIILLFFTIPFFHRFRLAWLSGASINLLFIAVGALLVWYNDIRHTKSWFGHSYTENTFLIVSLDEPLVEKTKSFKSNASVKYLIRNDSALPVKGKIILYFKKDSLLPKLNYGSSIILKKSLQEIRNSGNPGGFDYKRYSLFQGITHQCYLEPGEFEILKGGKETLYQKLFYPARDKVLSILRANIQGTKEPGLAEALLIGYKDDLDKTLVQSYSNTGVVHVIAISGLHIGLVYWLLVLLLKPLHKRKYFQWLQPVTVITGLWLFSLLAGGQPSVLRSAVMFTCIVVGQSFVRKTSVYNTLAFSAFILLCYNPYWLWDVGFQLSYSAVLSIIIFMKPIYNCFYIKNKILDLIWKLNPVTLAAQILTVPVSIYHFHQFPTYFLLTNLVAVPLSSAIVLGEIFLCAISFIPSAALFTGKILSWLIGLMNSYVERIESLPGSLWDGMQIGIVRTIVLLLLIAGISGWLMEKMKQGLIAAMVLLIVFFALRSYSFNHVTSRTKIIVYNVPRHRAIDFIEGRKYLFYGDSALLKDDFAQNFHLKPSRTLNRISPVPNINGLIINDKYVSYKTKKILLIDETVSFLSPAEKPGIDLLIISKDPKLYIGRLAATFHIKQVIFDASVAAGKLKWWKKDCDSLHIPWHDVNEKGAFVMNLN